MIPLGGDRMLESLLLFLKQHDMQLMTGRIALRLQPRALEYAVMRLASLLELQTAATTPQAAASAGSGDIGGVKEVLRLETLQRLLAHVRWLKVESALPGLRDPTGLSFEPFSNLKKLELRGCDLGTAGWGGLPLLQGQLEELWVSDTLEAVHHLLAPHVLPVTAQAVAEQKPWRALRVLVCSHNCVADMDASLRLLPALRSLTLTYSNLSSIANLEACTALTSLDLSYNRITDLAGLRGVRGAPLECLSLEWNALRSTAGLEDLPQLRALDLGYNFVCGISEAVRLSGLTSLRALRLAGNPVAFARSYRCDVLSCFPQRTTLLLDGAVANLHECSRLQRRPTGGRLGKVSQPVYAAPGGSRDSGRSSSAEQSCDSWQSLVDEMLGPVRSRWKPKGTVQGT